MKYSSKTISCGFSLFIGHILVDTISYLICFRAIGILSNTEKSTRFFPLAPCFLKIKTEILFTLILETFDLFRWLKIEKFYNWIYTYSLRWACKWVLISSALGCLKGMSFNKIGNRVLWTPTVHQLLGRVFSVRIGYICPSNISKVLAALQLFNRLAHLE